MGVAATGMDAPVEEVRIGFSLGLGDASVTKDVCDGGLLTVLFELTWVLGVAATATDEAEAVGGTIGTTKVLPAGRVTGILEGSGGGGGPPTVKAESSQALIQPP